MLFVKFKISVIGSSVMQCLNKSSYIVTGFSIQFCLISDTWCQSEKEKIQNKSIFVQPVLNEVCLLLGKCYTI